MIADLHVDFDYQEGMSNDCGKPLCCRSDSGKPKSPETTSGKWGDYNCDLSEKTLKNMMSFIKDGIKPDAVFWGGDSIPHNIESQSYDDDVSIMKNVTEIVADGLDGLRVYPTIGNHDTYPQNIVNMLEPKANPAMLEWTPTWK